MPFYFPQSLVLLQKKGKPMLRYLVGRASTYALRSVGDFGPVTINQTDFTWGFVKGEGVVENLLP